MARNGPTYRSHGSYPTFTKILGAGWDDVKNWPSPLSISALRARLVPTASIQSIPDATPPYHPPEISDTSKVVAELQAQLKAAQDLQVESEARRRREKEDEIARSKAVEDSLSSRLRQQEEEIQLATRRRQEKEDEVARSKAVEELLSSRLRQQEEQLQLATRQRQEKEDEVSRSKAVEVTLSSRLRQQEQELELANQRANAFAEERKQALVVGEHNLLKRIRISVSDHISRKRPRSGSSPFPHILDESSLSPSHSPSPASHHSSLIAYNNLGESSSATLEEEVDALIKSIFDDQAEQSNRSLSQQPTSSSPPPSSSVSSLLTSSTIFDQQTILSIPPVPSLPSDDQPEIRLAAISSKDIDVASSQSTSTLGVRANPTLAPIAHVMDEPQIDRNTETSLQSQSADNQDYVTATNNLSGSFNIYVPFFNTSDINSSGQYRPIGYSTSLSF